MKTLAGLIAMSPIRIALHGVFELDLLVHLDRRAVEAGQDVVCEDAHDDALARQAVGRGSAR